MLEQQGHKHIREGVRAFQISYVATKIDSILHWIIDERNITFVYYFVLKPKLML